MTCTPFVRRAVLGAATLAIASFAFAAPRDPSDASRLRQPAQSGPRETVIIRGSTTWEPINILTPNRFAAVAPKITLDIENPPIGSTGGLRALIEGTCLQLGLGLTDGPDADTRIDCDVNNDGVVVQPDATVGGPGKVPTIAQSSRPVTANEFATVSNSLGSLGLELIAVQGAKDGLAIVVSKDNPLASLSQAQIQTLFLNLNADWQDYGVDLSLGGVCPDNDVNVYTRNTNGGTFDSFIDLMLGSGNRAAMIARMGSAWGGVDPPTVTVVDTALDGVAAVAGDGCGVFYAGIGDFINNADTRGVPAFKTVPPAIDPSFATITSGQYPYSRNMFFATIGVPGVASAEGKYLDWMLSRSGQSVVTEGGFVPAYEIIPVLPVVDAILGGYPAP